MLGWTCQSIRPLLIYRDSSDKGKVLSWVSQEQHRKMRHSLAQSQEGGQASKEAFALAEGSQRKDWGLVKEAFLEEATRAIL